LSEVITIRFANNFLFMTVPEGVIFLENVENVSFLLSSGLVYKEGDFNEGIKAIFVSNLAENVLMVLILLFIDLEFSTGFIFELDEVVFLLIELLNTMAIVFQHFSIWKLKYSLFYKSNSKFI
jgi:hypothetical protein